MRAIMLPALDVLTFFDRHGEATRPGASARTDCHCSGSTLPFVVSVLTSVSRFTRTTGNERRLTLAQQ